MLRRFSAATSAALFLIAGFALVGCDGDSTRPRVIATFQDITIVASGDTLIIGESEQFSFMVTDTGGNPVVNPDLTWSSSDETIATVDDDGLVTATGEGSAMIMASGGGITSNTITQVAVQGFGWVDQTDGANVLNHLRGVHFVNFRRGWAVGDLGTIIATTDAGVTWQRQTSNSATFSLRSVFFTTPTRGFVVGTAGRILETIDAGVTWTIRTGIDTDGGKALNDVFFLDELTGFIVGNAGLVLRTIDGGTDWTRLQPAVTDRNLHSVSAFFDGANVRAWAVGNLGTIVGTRNGGDTWSLVVPSVASENLRGVARRSVAEAVAVGAQDRVARTMASADSAVWETAPSPIDFTNFEDASWPAQNRIFAVGENVAARANVLLSTDGAQSWSTQDLPVGAPLIGNKLFAVWFWDEHRGWAVGENGLILHTATGGS